MCTLRSVVVVVVVAAFYSFSEKINRLLNRRFDLSTQYLCIFVFIYLRCAVLNERKTRSFLLKNRQRETKKEIASTTTAFCFRCFIGISMTTPSFGLRMLKLSYSIWLQKDYYPNLNLFLCHYYLVLKFIYCILKQRAINFWIVLTIFIGEPFGRSNKKKIFVFVYIILFLSISIKKSI